MQVLASLAAGATSALLVVLAERSLAVGPGGFGLLLAAIGVGAAVGPLLLRRYVRPGDKRWLFGPFAVRGGVDIVLAVPDPAIASGALVVYDPKKILRRGAESSDAARLLQGKGIDAHGLSMKWTDPMKHKRGFTDRSRRRGSESD